MTPSHIQHQEQCDRLPTLTSHSTAATLLSQHPLRFLMHQRSNSSCTSSWRKRTKFRVTSRNAVPTFSIFVGKLRKSAIPSYSIYPYWLPWVSAIFKSHNLKRQQCLFMFERQSISFKSQCVLDPSAIAIRVSEIPVFEIFTKNQLEERGWQFIMLLFRLVRLDGYRHLSQRWKRGATQRH